MIRNVLFTGDEIRTVIERSDLPMIQKCQIWASFIDYAQIDKRLNVVVTSADLLPIDGGEGRDFGDEHPNLFV